MANKKNFYQKKQRLTPEQLEQLLVVYKQNINMDEVARRLDMTVDVLYRHLRENNIKLRGRHRNKIPKKTVARVVELYQDESIPVVEIIRRLKLRETDIYQCLARSNITSRKSRQTKPIYREAYIDDDPIIQRSRYRTEIEERLLQQKIVNMRRQQNLTSEDIAKICNVPLLTVYLYL